VIRLYKDRIISFGAKRKAKTANFLEQHEISQRRFLLMKIFALP
jgi:hypothetical protein